MANVISSARNRWRADLRREFRLDPPLTVNQLGVSFGDSTFGRVRAAEFKARLQDAGLRALSRPMGHVPAWRPESVTTIATDASQIVAEQGES